MAAPCQLAYRVGRDIRDGVCRRSRHAFGDELGGEGTEPAEAELFPRADEVRCGAGGDEGGAGRTEGDPPAGTFAATLDGPRGRRPTAPAQGSPKWAEQGSARSAEPSGRSATGNAARREKCVEEPRSRRYVGGRHVCVTALQQEWNYSGE